MEQGATKSQQIFPWSTLLLFREAVLVSCALLRHVNHQIRNLLVLFFVPVAGELSLTQESPDNFVCLHNQGLDRDFPRVKLFLVAETADFGADTCGIAASGIGGASLYTVEMAGAACA